MKITTLLMFILFVGVVFVGFTYISNDLSQHYSNGTEINTSFWEDKYNYTSEINETIDPLREKFKDITDEDKGFFTRIGSGIVAIPYAVILFPIIALKGLATLTGMVTGMATFLKVPTAIIFAGITILIIFIIGKLLGFFQKSEA